MHISSDNIIEFNDVSKRFAHGENALVNITFTLKTGEMAFLTGHSGAGKSTLLKLVAAIESPTTGDIIVGEKNLRHLSRHGIAALRRSIGIVFQDPQLLEQRTVFNNVALPLTLAGFGYRDNIPRVHAALDMVGLLNKENRYPESLSVGEKQRVGIARAIVNRPPLLLADEPTGNLDPDLALEIMELFLKLNKSGISILIATHDLGLIAPLRHRILTLKQGNLLT
jgi:cell division transport system ATP-binding protein